MDTDQTKEALLFTWDQLTKWLAGRDIDVEDAYYPHIYPPPPARSSILFGTLRRLPPTSTLPLPPRGGRRAVR